ncbi:DNA polymerase IV [Candidatus Omnitrophota bacterium]
MKERLIVHVDMDAFFAAIEQRDHPKFRGKPVIIGADPKGGKGRGVVSTSSYEARKFGIHSAMPISEAYRKCPGGIFLPVDMEKYARESRRIHNILYSFTPEMEPISIDEAFLDITGSYQLFGTPQETCMLIKSKIKKETGLTASVGLAPVKMAAKIASDLEKPDGFVEVTGSNLLEFLWGLDIRKMWGLGEKSEKIFRSMGINTIGDLARKDSRTLEEVFGKNGVHFWELANGRDPRPVETETETKSVSNELTFGKDTDDDRKLESALMTLSEKVSGRLRHDGLKGRTITLKIRLTGFKTYTRAVTVEKCTNFADVLYKEVKRLYNVFDKRGKKVRLIGVKVSNLSTAGFRDSLFGETKDEKQEQIHKAVDRIKDKYGDDSIHRATTH